MPVAFFSRSTRRPNGIRFIPHSTTKSTRGQPTGTTLGRSLSGPSDTREVEQAMPATSTTRSGRGQSLASTALSVLRISLETLKDASSCVPVPGFTASILLLLSVVSKCQTVSENAEGFRDLAERMNHLQPILGVVHEIEDKTGTLTLALNDLVGALDELAEAIQCALSQGKLSRFFQGREDAASIRYHTEKLDSIIAGLSLGLNANTGHNVDRLRWDLSRVESTVDRMHNDVMGLQSMFASSPGRSFTGAIKGVDTTPTPVGRNDIRMDDTKSVTHVAMDPDRSDSPLQCAAVSGLEVNLSGALVELENGSIGSRNTALRKLDMRNGVFKVKGGSIGCGNTSISPMVDPQIALLLSQLVSLQCK